MSKKNHIRSCYKGLIHCITKIQGIILLSKTSRTEICFKKSNKADMTAQSNNK